MRIAIILSIVLYIIALIGNSYYFLIENSDIKKIWDILFKIILVFRNGIFVGFPLFTIGILVAYKEKDIKNISKYKLYVSLIIFVITQIVEAIFIRGKNYKDDHSLFLSTIFIATILLMICIIYSNIRVKRINTVLLRNLSTGIYYIHFPICRYIRYFIPDINLWILFVVTIVLSIALNMILLKINNKYINLLIK